jgi:hypothetical protein
MRFNDVQNVYMNAYLHAYADEYHYVGRLRYHQVELTLNVPLIRVMLVLP